MDNTLEIIKKNKIIAIIRKIESKYILNTVKALYNGGIRCFEITFDHDNEDGITNTINNIEILKQEFQEKILLGAGTVLNTKEVELAKKAGVKFLLTPNTDIEVIRCAKENGLIIIPGAFSPSEVVKAWENGGDIIKVFPADSLGKNYLKALKGPLSHIKFSAVGGINLENMLDFLKNGASCVGIGGNLVDKSLIEKEEYNKIEEIAKKYVDLIKE